MNSYSSIKSAGMEDNCKHLGINIIFFIPLLDTEKARYNKCLKGTNKILCAEAVLGQLYWFGLGKG